MSFHLPGLGGAFGSTAIESEAARLAEKLERLCERHGVTELDIVGHSKGGLVARYMVTHFPVGKRVRTCIGLGTPFRGAPLAFLGAPTMGLLSKSIWQLTPLSPFLRQMAKTPVPHGMKLVSISGALDLIAPAVMCRLRAEEADPGLLKNHVVAGIGHNSLLMSRRVFALIVQELSGG